MTYILGINSFHPDASATLVKDDKIVAAIEEERIVRTKHWSGFPIESIKYCLDESKIDISQIKHIAINSNKFSNLEKKIIYCIKNPQYLNFYIERFKSIKKKNKLEDIFLHHFKTLPDAKIHYIDHHLCHIASSFYLSGFDNAIVLSIDGFGDFASTASGTGKGKSIKIDQRNFFPHSMGIFYQAITQLLGFKNYGDEYKVMGMTAYGSNKFKKEMDKIVSINTKGDFKLNLNYFNHHKSNISFNFQNGNPNFKNLYNRNMVELFGDSIILPDQKLTQKHFDIAHSAQKKYEDFFLKKINYLNKKTGLDKLCLSGGCAMNSLANGKVYRNSKFNKVFIQPASGDGGTSLGAALYVAKNVLKFNNKISYFDSSYLGPKFSNKEIEIILNENINLKNSQNFSIKYFDIDDDLFFYVAEKISKKLVVGWFSGRSEWGPRALGNRSILADARAKDMKEILNKKIKKRESFRPFAPSILESHVNNWFKENKPVPFMTQVFEIKDDKRHIIPAVTHVDGTGRLQTVNEKNNKRFFHLINKFYEITGVPIVINTSFNENEPIVNKPIEAINCFLRTNMDLLVLENFVVERTK